MLKFIKNHLERPLIIDENEDGPLLDIDEESTPLGTKGSYLAYPKEWSESFGNDYYSNKLDSI